MYPRDHDDDTLRAYFAARRQMRDAAMAAAAFGLASVQWRASEQVSIWPSGMTTAYRCGSTFFGGVLR